MGNGDTFIFCDNCSSLALAELDDEFLCADCLLDHVSSGDLAELTLDIRPLVINARRSPIRARDREMPVPKAANF